MGIMAFLGVLVLSLTGGLLVGLSYSEEFGGRLGPTGQWAWRLCGVGIAAVGLYVIVHTLFPHIL
jgi:hypothetical protein